jgi:hypothetical protein
MTGRVRRLAAFVVAALSLMGRPAVAQVHFLRGQNIAPVYEGWRRDPDGTIRMYFGYLNRNYEEVLDIPVGPNNSFEPADVDRGQPTHFLTRRQRFVFQVRLPKDFDIKSRLIWTVTVNGKTEKAQGWLQPEWEIDDGVIQMNLGPGGAPPDPPNSAPSITGATTAAATVADGVTLTATATDDGIPKPRVSPSGPVANSGGVSIRWIYYRGPGSVTFSADKSARVFGAPVKLETHATFSAPGVYVLRAIASDGLLETPLDVTVSVK